MWLICIFMERYKRIVTAKKKTLSPTMTTFSQGNYNSAAYRAYRTNYTPAFYEHILNSHHGARNVALDVATGTGQVAVELSNHFGKVYAIDKSPVMLSSAIKAPNVEYSVSVAEKLDFPDHSVDLITVVQGAHWFDIDVFFAEARRVLAPNGTLAILGYTYVTFPDNPSLTNAVYDLGNKEEYFGPYWEPGRLIVDDLYRSFRPPFKKWIRREYLQPGKVTEMTSVDGKIVVADLPADTPRFVNTRLSVNHLNNYMRTFTAYKRFCDAHPDQVGIIDELMGKLAVQDGIENRDSPLKTFWVHGLLLAGDSL